MRHGKRMNDFYSLARTSLMLKRGLTAPALRHGSTGTVQGKAKAFPTSLKTSHWLVFRALGPELAASAAQTVLAPAAPALVAARESASARSGQACR